MEEQLLEQAGMVYYIDAETGNDDYPGTSPKEAWRTLEKVNGIVWQPGDTLLFRAGGKWCGQFKPQGSGTSGQPIMVDKFGGGSKPIIAGNGLVLDAVLLENVEYWEVRNLEVTNEGAEREEWRTGIRLCSNGFGAMRHIRLSDLYVHDVNGSLDKSTEGCGIYFESTGTVPSWFEDLIIEHCHVVRTDRNGICQRTRFAAARSVKVIVRHNKLENIGGDAIKLWGTNGGLIEHNTVQGGRMRCEDGAAGIWPFACDDTLIQYNEVSGMRGILDGQGFDSDFSCRNSIFQYNYSHDNEGGFILVCSPGFSYCEGTIIRYNISQNDGINTARVFHFGGGASDTHIYNNTVYVSREQKLPLFLFTEWEGGTASNTYVYNNIFYVDGEVTYDFTHSANHHFRANVYYGNHANLPDDPEAITADPLLMLPGGGKEGNADAYRLRPGSPALGSGVHKEGYEGTDYWGNALVCGSDYGRGACVVPVWQTEGRTSERKEE
jgi:hypothetical protein